MFHFSTANIEMYEQNVNHYVMPVIRDCLRTYPNYSTIIYTD